MKTIGVIGGLGPQATTDIEARLHAFAPQVIPPHMNNGFPPMIVYYLRHAPVLLDETQTRPIFPLQIDPRLLDVAKFLGKHVDFLIITANGPHTFRERIEGEAGKPILSIIDATVAEVQRRGVSRVGVLEFVQGHVYHEPLAQVGISTIYIPPEFQASLDNAIQELQQGTHTATTRGAVDEAIAWLWDQNVETIVLGCTDIPVLMGTDADLVKYVNPNQILAEAAVRFAIE